MIETYIRPFWLKTLIFLGLCLGVALFETLVVAVLLPLVNPGFDIFTIKDTIWGPLPEIAHWAVVWLIVSPPFGLVGYFIIGGLKYDREWRKLGLLPVFAHDPNQVMFCPRKDEGKEPLWKEKYEFEATLKVMGHREWPVGHGTKSYVILVDENNLRYQMSDRAFNSIADRFVNGEFKGKFRFNTGWKWPSIEEVK